MNYLHNEAHPLAMIIHRDLKPENLGLNADGVLKLFDFGLCRCVKKRTSSNESYTMTGCAGSLRYMAPEVVLKKPYSEKVDVYSYGLVVWAMAKNDNPYKYYDRETHRSRVVMKGERPELYSQWPKDFRDLLTSCWAPDPSCRPTFEEIHTRLSALTDANPSSGLGMGMGLTPLLSSTIKQALNSSGKSDEAGEIRRMSSVSTQSESSAKTFTTANSEKSSTKKRIGQALRSIFSFAKPADS
jgi:serine/threonine protein kinase